IVGATGGTPGYQFSINGGSTFQASGTFNTLLSGNYILIVQDGNGCQDNMNVIINDLNGITASITAQSNPVCNGLNTGSLTITASGSVAAYSYLINGGSTFQLSGTFTGLSAGMYTIIAQDANSCPFNVAVNIIEPTVVGGSIVSQTDVSCSGNTDGQVTIAGSGGTPGYQYSINNGTTYQASGTFAGLAIGAYNIIVRDAN